jgi:hypothetical protein
MSIRALQLPFDHSEIEIDIATSNLLDILLPRHDGKTRSGYRPVAGQSSSGQH